MSELEKLCEEKGVKADFVYGAAITKGWDGAAHNWRVTLTYQRRRLTVDFFGGSAVTDPSAADVLGSLIHDAYSGDMDFEDFCAEVGDDPDSRRAHATWKACAAIGPKVRRLLGEDFETFAKAEH